MANTDNVLDGQGPSLIDAAVDDNGNQQPGSDVPPPSANSVGKYGVQSWGQPRAPLRRPFSFRNHLTMEEPESPEKTTSEDPVDSSRAPTTADGPVPAVAEDSLATVEDSLATAEVKTSEGPVGWKGMGHNPTNVSGEFPGGPSSLAIGGIRFTRGDTWIGGNNARPYVPLPTGPVSFDPRGPPIRAPPSHPPFGVGIMMQQPLDWRMAYNEGQVYAPFPVGGPTYPMENCPRPIFPTCTGPVPPPTEVSGLPSPIVFPTGPPGFAVPRIIRPPLPSHDATSFPSWCKKRMEQIKK